MEYIKRALILVLMIIGCVNSYSQSISCQELFSTVTSNYDTKDTASCYNSSMLAKVIYYEYENMGFVVAYIKSGDYDFSGKPYIFCGISSYTWSSFKTNGMTGSWGESFHEYIMDQTCNCY